MSPSFTDAVLSLQLQQNGRVTGAPSVFPVDWRAAKPDRPSSAEWVGAVPLFTETNRRRTPPLTRTTRTRKARALLPPLDALYAVGVDSVALASEGWPLPRPPPRDLRGRKSEHNGPTAQRAWRAPSAMSVLREAPAFLNACLRRSKAESRRLLRLSLDSNSFYFAA
ncbi:hypothetical protein MTO96_040352 [Rhipicephalus appendiculatus]